jgi:hypothetical protein
VLAGNAPVSAEAECARADVRIVTNHEVAPVVVEIHSGGGPGVNGYTVLVLVAFSGDGSRQVA